MIRLTFDCDGPTGLERIGECSVRQVVVLDSLTGYSGTILPDSIECLKSVGWTIRYWRGRMTLRCPKCEETWKKRAEAKRQTRKMARERKWIDG